MKVVQITGAYVGAQKKLAKQIHENITKNGWQSEILFGFGSEESSHEHRYEPHVFNVIRRSIYKYCNKYSHSALLSTFRLITMLNESEPDIVHLHIVHHGYVDFQLLFKYLSIKRIPVVYTVHDMWPFTGGCYYYTDIDCEKFFTGCLDCQKDSSLMDCSKNNTFRMQNIKKQLYSTLEKIIFVGVSDWVSAEMNKSFLRDYPRTTILNSVDIEPKVHIDDNHKKFRILGVATSWTERKGIDRYLELASKLSDDYEIILVGSVSNQIKANVPQKITFKGLVKNQSDLEYLYQTSDIHISMSYEETFGLTFIEAAMAGIKSIGFNSSAIPGVLDKIFGYVIDKGDIDGMVKLLEYLKSDREGCYLSERQQDSVQEAFSCAKMVREYEDIYSSILQ